MGAHVTARLLTEFELGVHQCRKCVTNCKSIRYSPVYSFGDPQGKPIIVVGINPSSAEYERKNGGSPYLNDSNDVHMRSASQLQYFENHVYDFFETVQEFFDDSVKAEVVSWATSPWERVV